MTEKSTDEQLKREKSGRPELLALSGVFLLAVAARVAFLMWHGPDISPDSQEYLILARNLLAHKAFSLSSAYPFTPTVRFPPLYPAFIAALSWSGEPSPFGVAAVQALLGGLAAVLLVSLTRIVLPMKWAIGTGVFYALHPAAISSASAVLAETLFTAILLTAVWALVHAIKRNQLRVTAACGLALGLATLCRPVVTMLPIVFAAMMLLLPRITGRKRQALLLLALSFLVITPWAVRSSLIAGHMILVQDPAVIATLFYVPTRLDWNQEDQAQLWPRMQPEVERLRANMDTPSTKSERQIGTARILVVQGLRNIADNPLGYLGARARAFPHLFLTSFDSFTGINRSFGTLLAERDLLRLGLKLALLTVFSLVPFLLGLVGLLSVKRSLVAALGAAVWLYIFVMALPLWIEPRYWLPAIPFLLISASIALHRLQNGRERRSI